MASSTWIMLWSPPWFIHILTVCVSLRAFSTLWEFCQVHFQCTENANAH